MKSWAYSLLIESPQQKQLSRARASPVPGGDQRFVIAVPAAVIRDTSGQRRRRPARWPGCIVQMEETMIAARKSILLGLAALALATGLSGCIVAERPGRYHGDYMAERPSWHPHHWSNNYQGGGNWQGGGGWGGN